MAAKKDKTGVDAVRADIQSLADAFWSFRDAMLTDAAVAQSEQQVQAATDASISWPTPTAAAIDASAALLFALGHPQRLRIAMMLAQGPTSVTSMVESLELKTTGAAYHHLNVLMTAGIAVQPERGTYGIAPEASVRANAVLAALYGASPATAVASAKKKKKG